MGLFGNNEEKKEQKAQALLAKYGLQEISNQKDLESLRKISCDLMGNQLIELGATLTGKPEDGAKLSYLHAIMQQNFIMIRQLDRIAKLLEK